MYTRSSKLFRAFIHEASVNQYHCLDTIKGKRIKFQTCPFSTSSKSLNMVCVVSTSSRGIGLEFTRQLLSKPGTTVIALVRGPESSLHASSPSSLLALKSAYPNHLHIIDNVDLENPTTFPMVRQRITKLTSHVDLLVNSAGILGDASTTPGPERSITRVENNWTTKTFQINTIAPMMLTKELLDLLKEGGKKTKSMKNDEKIPANTTESGSVAPPPSSRIKCLCEGGEHWRQQNWWLVLLSYEQGCTEYVHQDPCLGDYEV